MFQVHCSVVSNSLQPYGLQHAMLPCPSSTPRRLLKLKSINSVMPFNHLIFCHTLLFLPAIFPSIRGFSNELVLHISWPEYWSFSFSISLPMTIQDWFPLGWTGWISLQSKGFSRVFFNTTVQKHQFFHAQLSLQSNFHIHTWLLENHSLD